MDTNPLSLPFSNIFTFCHTVYLWLVGNAVSSLPQYIAKLLEALYFYYFCRNAFIVFPLNSLSFCCYALNLLKLTFITLFILIILFDEWETSYNAKCFQNHWQIKLIPLRFFYIYIGISNVENSEVQRHHKENCLCQKCWYLIWNMNMWSRPPLKFCSWYWKKNLTKMKLLLLIKVN